MPIYLHADDHKWITPPYDGIVTWAGESREISDNIRLWHTGGHFAGATILHWRKVADRKGALFAGDIAIVAMDRRSASFMYSFPNYIPMNEAAVLRIADVVAPLTFERISVRRYLAAIKPA